MDSYLTDTKFYEIIDSIKDLIVTFDPILFGKNQNCSLMY